jgi:hypothetical protein
MTDQFSLFLEQLGKKHRKARRVCGWGEEMGGDTTDMRDKLGFIVKPQTQIHLHENCTLHSLSYFPLCSSLFSSYSVFVVVTGGRGGDITGFVAFFGN